METTLSKYRHAACALLIGAAVVLLAVPGARAAESAADIKAAFVYNFAKFAEWPAAAFAEPTAPLVLCVLGERALDGRWPLLAGREAQGHRIQVIKLESVDQDATRCHILFVSAAEPDVYRPLLEKLAGKPVLTVGDHPGFDSQGGMIALFVHAGRLKFSVNLAAVQAADLKLSARILQLAHSVGREP